MPHAASRMPLIDALKAIACLLIVLHHLAFYGPMSDVAYPLMPVVLDWLYRYGRIAVQVFFVVAGFLLAAKLAPAGRSVITDPVREIKRRYIRLAMPYLAALALSMICAALARMWLVHDSIPAEPGLLQLASHVFFVQGLLGQESLSAGVWYVAIDFQLFALSVILFRFSTYIEFHYPILKSTLPVLIALVTTCSLFGFNRDAWWDDTALYFFASYGLGILGYWASSRARSMAALALLCMLFIAALLVDFRSRIAVAGVVMLVLAIARRTGLIQSIPVPELLIGLGRISYSVFLVHFPVCLIVNAAFLHFFPDDALINAVGMGCALVASVVAGGLFYQWIENRPLTRRMRLILPAGFAASALLVELAGR